ncbi:MAG: PAS domain S-box protein [Spartobacteria bacterium]|nr:PAS domain S-box protein [Spartobacteria bacterium]
MTEEGEFSNTMRIDIPLDAMADPTSAAQKMDTKLIRRRSPVIKVPQSPRHTGETKYDQLLQSIYDGVLISTLSGDILDANARAMDFLSFSKEDLRSKNVLDIIAGADSALLASLRENLQNQRFALLQAYCVRKDRTFFPAEIAVNILRFSEMQMCFFIRDITLRKQAEERLRTEHNAIQNAGNGIAIVDEDGMLEYVNPAMVKLWGYAQPEEMEGRDVWNLLDDEETGLKIFRQLMATGEDWSGELVAQRRSSGTLFDVQVSASCNHDSDGELVGAVFSFLDISDRKRAQAAMRQTEQHKVMLASLGAACHHLGQPATVLLTNLEMLQRKIQEDDAGELVTASVNAAELIAEILHKLNMVDEYRTCQYLDDRNDPDSPTNRILAIE